MAEGTRTDKLRQVENSDNSIQGEVSRRGAGLFSCIVSWEPVPIISDKTKRKLTNRNAMLFSQEAVFSGPGETCELTGYEFTGS